MKPILLTFDLEYWFESLSVQKYLTGNEKDNLQEFINKLLDLLKSVSASATFFVTEKILNNEQELIKKINNYGHEIAIHCLDHKPLWDKNPDISSQELKILSNKIENLINKKPIGHRAVNFSLNKSTSWAIEILKNNNLIYDSSILQFGIKPNFFNVNNFQEIKVFSGGIYIRIIPWFLFKFLLKNKLKKSFVCLYFHPYDFAQKKPDIKMPGLKKFVKYYNTKNTWRKLEYILKNYKCLCIEKYYYENITNQSLN